MKILFVCMGNTCRSPLAEAIARREALERSLEIEMQSAGTDAREGAPATEDSQTVALENGLDLSRHRARQLSNGLVAQCEMVLVMTPEQLQHQTLRVSNKAHFVTTYAEPPDQPVVDPYCKGIEAYRACYAQLENAIQRLFDKLEAERA